MTLFLMETRNCFVAYLKDYYKMFNSFCLKISKKPFSTKLNCFISSRIKQNNYLKHFGVQSMRGLVRFSKRNLLKLSSSTTIRFVHMTKVREFCIRIA